MVEGHGALLVCSNDTHARMFAPVARELATRGWTVRLVSLDCYYDQGATETSSALGFASIALERRGRRDGAMFYRRPAFRVWVDIIRNRTSARRLIEDARATVVLVGNDRGLVEKLIIDRARRTGVRSVLVQDGVVADEPAPEERLSRRLVRTGRRFVSRLLCRLDLPYLAASRYGEGGTDLVCVSGPSGLEVITSLGVARERIVVTGQPRYDELRAAADRSGEEIIWFTTPFRHQNLGDEPQRRQAEFVREAAASLTGAGLHLVVKPHPRERADTPGKQDNVSVRHAPPSELLNDAKFAIVGISTVVEEAAIAGVPVLVPGQRVHANRFDHLLPPPDRYPRFETGAELVVLLDRYEDGPERDHLIESQRSFVMERLDFGSDRSASARIADALEAFR